MTSQAIMEQLLNFRENALAHLRTTRTTKSLNPWGNKHYLYEVTLGLSARRREHDLVLELIQQHGMDPFFRYHQVLQPGPATTAFHEVSDHGADLDVLLAMAAHPYGTEWSKRYFFSQNKVTNAPVQGRPQIKTEKCLFRVGKALSLEGLEVLLMCGYKLTEEDVVAVSVLAGREPEQHLRTIKFCLAAKKSNIAGNLSLLNYCLGVAIGGPLQFLGGEVQPTCIELARILLQAGADPNGKCLEDDYWDGFTPAFCQALKNRDSEMAKLLLEYGADPNQPAIEGSWAWDGSSYLEESISPKTIAAENGMEDILLRQQAPITKANPQSYLEELRCEFLAQVKEVASNQTALLVVACMRATAGHAPPLGLLCKTVLELCHGDALRRFDQL